MLLPGERRTNAGFAVTAFSLPTSTDDSGPLVVSYTTAPDWICTNPTGPVSFVKEGNWSSSPRNAGDCDVVAEGRGGALGVSDVPGVPVVPGVSDVPGVTDVLGVADVLDAVGAVRMGCPDCRSAGTNM